MIRAKFVQVEGRVKGGQSYHSCFDESDSHSRGLATDTFARLCSVRVCECECSSAHLLLGE